MSIIYYPEHNAIHNELVNNGWTIDNSNSNNKKKFIYTRSNVNPYDEFIINYISANEVAVTVPIPCSSISYRNTFLQRDTQIIQDYLKMHLSNYTCQ